ncbi:hypothetical protein FQZ97_771000 [compost metagenome]
MPRKTGGHVIQAIDPRLNGLHLLEELACLLSGMQSALEALEQRVAQTQLYRRQHAADGGLRHMQQPPGRAERTRDHDGVEHLDLPQVKRSRPDLSG